MHQECPRSITSADAAATTLCMALKSCQLRDTSNEKDVLNPMVEALVVSIFEHSTIAKLQGTKVRKSRYDLLSIRAVFVQAAAVQLLI